MKQLLKDNNEKMYTYLVSCKECFNIALYCINKNHKLYKQGQNKSKN